MYYHLTSFKVPQFARFIHAAGSYKRAVKVKLSAAELSLVSYERVDPLPSLHVPHHHRVIKAAGN